MEPTYLYIMDITVSGVTSGVDRHIEKLLEGLKAYPSIYVYRIRLLNDRALIIHHEEQNEYGTQVTLPLPQNYKEIVAEKFWMRKYNEHIFRIIKHLFPKKGNCILHLHTLNLIDLALLVKQHIPCKIITHLHCIPWKNYYNSNEKLFNYLYRLSRPDSPDTPPSRVLFATNNCEIDSYTQADRIISVTRCGVDFLINTMRIPQDKISTVPNGIDDYPGTCKGRSFKTPPSHIQCLFVANMSKSKGLDFVLDALRIVKSRGYDIGLKVAGQITPEKIAAIKVENGDLDVDFPGVLPFDRLAELYQSSDIGLIASLQEQWSLAGVEMAMFGLPVVTTAVDGLNEIFTDNVNALKVGTSFSTITGLTVNTDEMAEKVIRLIEHKELRMRLSKNVRQMYEEKLSLEHMIQQIIGVYQKTIGGPVI